MRRELIFRTRASIECLLSMVEGRVISNSVALGVVGDIWSHFG